MNKYIVLFVVILIFLSCKEDNQKVKTITPPLSPKNQSKVLLNDAIKDARLILNKYASSEREDNVNELLNLKFGIYTEDDVGSDGSLNLTHPICYLLKPVLPNNLGAMVDPIQCRIVNKGIIHINISFIENGLFHERMVEMIIHEMVHVAQAFDPNTLSSNEREFEAYKLASMLMLKYWGIENLSITNDCFNGMEDFKIKSKMISKKYGITQNQAMCLLKFYCTNNLIEFTQKNKIAI